MRAQLGVTPGALGLILLCAAIGSLTATPSAGTVVGRIGEARTIAIMRSVLRVGLVTIGIGYELGLAPACVGCSCSASATAPGTSR